VNWFINNWYIVVGIIAIIGGAAVALVNFLKLPREQQIQKVLEWLLGAVTEAEKELGGGTGKLKLAKVYDWFIDKFFWLAEKISFDKFSELVDQALDEMKHLIETNPSIAAYVAKRED